MIFVDTGAWYASVVPADANHAAASRWLSRNTAPLITTNYVVDETLTLLRARGQTVSALGLGDEFFQGALATVHHLSETEIFQAWQVFRQFTDKAWSFTDCSSKVVIERLRLTHAFSFDRHFQQFGSVIMVP